MKTVHFLGFECVVSKARYANGRPALILKDAHNGEEVAVATVNLPAVAVGPNQVFIKDYSENEGVLAALDAAGIVKSTNVMASAGFASVPICELLPPYRERTLTESLAESSSEKGKGTHGPEVQEPEPQRQQEKERGGRER